MQQNEIEVILQLLDIEKELDIRRGAARLQAYNTGKKVHLKQMEFHRQKSRNRWVFGGNRTGKTECGAVETVWTARGVHPFRENRKDVNGWIVSVSYEVQREVAQAKILQYLSRDWIVDIIMQTGRRDCPENGVIDSIIIKNVFGGLSKISFKSCDQGREKFQGASLDFVWFDEEPPKDIYEECLMRVLDRKGDIWGTMTPLKGLTWVYDEIFLNPHSSPEIWYTQIEWTDNPFLDSAEVERLISSTDADMQESRRFGRFKENRGLVYPEFNPEKHIIEPFNVPVEWQYSLSIDPGLNNPLSCHFYAVDGDGVLYVVAEHYEAEKDIDYHSKKIFELAEKIGWEKRSGRLVSLIDSAANQHTLAGSKSVAELFFDRGILVNTKVNKDLFSGIERLKSMFNSTPPKIYIFKNCVNLIRELKSYWWAEGDRPRKCDDHSLDELRYLVMSLPSNSKPKRLLKNEIQKDKEELIKKFNRQRKHL